MLFPHSARNLNIRAGGNKQTRTMGYGFSQTIIISIAQTQQMWVGIEENPQTRKIKSNVTLIKHIVAKVIKEYTADVIKQRNSPHSKRISDESSKAEEVEEVINDLKKGYIMTKHSNNTYPKTKFIYLSMNERFLCWKSVDKQDQKRIQVCTISNIVRDTSLYLSKFNKIKNYNCCVVIVADERTLVLEAVTPQECQCFEEDLEKAIKYCRKMSLNYHYLND